MSVAKEVRDLGRLLVATEIRSSDRYWHVRQKDESKKIYPEIYIQNVVGILWNTMAQFQTWFGAQPYLPYGIQLLPLTPASEQRDDPAWLREMYAPFADACGRDPSCEEQGWSVLQLAVLASVGHVGLAIERARNLPSEVFLAAGGNGHSLTNTIWYISTRKEVEPIRLPRSDTEPAEKPEKEEGGPEVAVDCGVPETCTIEVLDRNADSYSCRERIAWLINSLGKGEKSACAQVAAVEYPDQCGPCHPGDQWIEKEDGKQCPPCTDDQCSSDLNRCPVFPRTFVCTEGPSRGGCARTPWHLSLSQCQECCELTHCKKKPSAPGTKKEVEAGGSCPVCSKEVCVTREARLCPIDTAPYLCTAGPSTGGCSPSEWALGGGQCNECCLLTLECDVG
jgi:hypothetical protein